MRFCRRVLSRPDFIAFVPDAVVSHVKTMSRPEDHNRGIG